MVGFAYGGLSAVIRCKPLIRSCTSGAVEARCRVVWRAWVAIFPPISKSRPRSFFGSHRRDFLSVKAFPLTPGHDLRGEHDHMAPELVASEGFQRQVRQSGVLGIADTVLTAGP